MPFQTYRNLNANIIDAKLAQRHTDFAERRDFVAGVWLVEADEDEHDFLARIERSAAGPIPDPQCTRERCAPMPVDDLVDGGGIELPLEAVVNPATYLVSAEERELGGELEPADGDASSEEG